MCLYVFPCFLSSSSVVLLPVVTRMMNANVSSDHLISPIPLSTLTTLYSLHSNTHTVHTHSFPQNTGSHLVLLLHPFYSISFTSSYHSSLSLQLWTPLQYFTIREAKGRERVIAASPTGHIWQEKQVNRKTFGQLFSSSCPPKHIHTFHGLTFHAGRKELDAMSCNPFTTSHFSWVALQYLRLGKAETIFWRAYVCTAYIYSHLEVLLRWENDVQ